MSGKWLRLTRGGLISGTFTVVTTNDEKSAEVIGGKMYRRTEQYSIQSKDWRLQVYDVQNTVFNRQLMEG